MKENIVNNNYIEKEKIMLYEIDENKTLQPLEFYNVGDLNKNEKDLENLLVKNLEILFTEKNQLMPIFQERQRQEEPDLYAIDKYGNLVIFELKKNNANENAVNQIMRYAQKFGKMKYTKLNKNFKKFTENPDSDLQKSHQESFGLDEPLSIEKFNLHQKMYIIGNSLDLELIETIEYWKNKKVDIDFLPYRIYKINNKDYFEFFAKPYDYNQNIKDRKGIIFDTNKTYNSKAVFDMMKNDKISAYGDARKFIDYFRKNDYVLYYHKGFGIIAIGQIISEKPLENKENEERFHKVRILTTKIRNEKEMKFLKPSEITQILEKNFYYASTIKKPYLTTEEVEVLKDKLLKKYQENK